MVSRHVRSKVVWICLTHTQLRGFEVYHGFLLHSRTRSHYAATYTRDFVAGTVMYYLVAGLWHIWIYNIKVVDRAIGVGRWGLCRLWVVLEGERRRWGGVGVTRLTEGGNQ
jgi:hypothetical protein